MGLTLRRSSSGRAWALLGAMFAALAGLGCSTTPQHRTTGALAARAPDFERVRFRLEEGVQEVSPNWVLHPRLGMFEIDSRDASGFVVRVYPTGSTVRQDSGQTDPASTAPTSPALLQAHGELREASRGLPDRGQWRDSFALISRGGSEVTLYAPPTRKGSGTPSIWSRRDGTWTAEPQAWPAFRHEYGGIAVGDFDGDARLDVALAMHLQRFTALLADSGASWREQAAGLPGNRGARESGVAAATLRDRRADRLVLLRESDGVPPGPDASAGLAEYVWSGDAWRSHPIEPWLAGASLSLAQLPGCRPLLSVVPSGNNQTPVFERRRGRWEALDVSGALGPLPASLWYLSASRAGQMDGAGCQDLVLARWARTGKGWLPRIDVLLRDRGRDWHRMSIQPASPHRITALALNRSRAGDALLLSGDTLGRLSLYRMEGQDLAWIGTLEASEWRRGCAVSHIEALPAPEVGARWIVGFAGEGDLFAMDRCTRGGGLSEIDWLPQPPPNGAGPAEPALSGRH